MARSNIVCCYDVGWLVLLNISKLGACFLKLAVKDIEKGTVETYQHSNHGCFLINAVLVRYSSEHPIKKIINFVLGQ